MEKCSRSKEENFDLGTGKILYARINECLCRNNGYFPTIDTASYRSVWAKPWRGGLVIHGTGKHHDPQWHGTAHMLCYLSSDGTVGGDPLQKSPDRSVNDFLTEVLESIESVKEKI